MTSVESTGIGGRVRRLRQESGRTLAQTAADSGVSRSMISEIERGGRMPTVLVLDKIATAFGTSVARLMRDDAEATTTVLRAGEQDVLLDNNGWQRRILSPVQPGVEFEFMRTTLNARVDAGVFDPHAKGSREYLAVEKGTLRLSLDDEEYLLHAGDSIFYSGACHHGFTNPGRGTCVYYLVMDLGAHTPIRSSS